MREARSVRKLLVVLFAVAACSPSPSPSVPSSAIPTPTATIVQATAAPTATTAPTPSGPVAVLLPEGFRTIPWADLVDAGSDEHVVTIGVLGRPATTTRTFTHEPLVSADGPAVLLEVDGRTEIIDAASGQTIATFERAALQLPQQGIDPNDLTYQLANRFMTDVAHGYLYDLSANHAGVQLRRFQLDGSHETLLAILAPDPGKEFWTDIAFVVTAAGSVVATACPPATSAVADHRCRIFRAASGASGRIKPRYLPTGSPRPCFLLAADETFAIGGPYAHCGADGGPPQVLRYMALNLSTLTSTVVDAASDLTSFGMADEGDGPGLVANLGNAFPYPSIYPEIGVILRFGDVNFALDRFVEDVANPSSVEPYQGFVWAIRGRGQGWTLLHGYGPAYVACEVARSQEDVEPCPSGPEILETPKVRLELPPGTWGDIVPGRA